MRTRLLPLAAALVALPLLGLAAQDAEKRPTFPGPTADGFLLPNGWRLRPAGEHLPLTDLPLNIAPLADGKHALVATSGFNAHRLSLVDLTTRKVLHSQEVYQSYFGLAVSPDERRVWWAGGGANMVHTFSLADGALTRTSPPEPKPAKKKKEELTEKGKARRAKKIDFTAGLTFDARNDLLYSLDINRGTITARPASDPKASPRTGKLGGRPYDVVVSRNGARLYVSDWAGRQVLVVDPADLRVTARVAVGEHPNQMSPHPKDDRLFVACASSNSVAVLDTKRGVVLETIYTTLFPRAPQGSTPCAVAVSPDGGTLYVANADNNCVCVIDVSVPHRSIVKGFIPTGWYPVSVAVTPDGKNLLVGVGKGLGSKSNPLWKKEAKDDADKSGGRRLPFPYIGTLMSGALSVVPVPGERQLAEYTAQVYRCCPYADDQLTAAPHPVKTAIPTKVGEPSPIKHVIYVIKENRTYDQVFGALKQGNGDPSLVLFGEDVTPNHHKLAAEFVLLDNLYCNGQVSRDGHPWSTMAYHTDYIARDWHLTYSRRKGVEDDDQGNLSNAPSGYLWDACARAGLSYRSYGECGKRVSDGEGGAKMEGRVPGLVGKICPDYGVSKDPKKRPRDTENVEVFLREYREFEKSGKMPRFIVMSLGEDHTSGTTPSAYTPKSCVASNDLALGRLVEAVTNGKYWKETAIFVIEDDAQNGPDHVDCHRTVGLVISPYTKRKAVDSTHYTTVSMIRTIELILGLSPLSQYDAAARPMFGCFTDKADLTPYRHEKARVKLDEKNTKKDYGAERSARMDWSDYDRIDDFELNEILWRSIKGRNAPLPPAVRRAIAYRPADPAKK
jgi:YVTN family beta-propeller protein